MMTPKTIPGSVLHEHREFSTDPLEITAIARQQRRFGAISLLAILVSFVHMGAALALFSGPSWYEVGAALAMTALVDIATWAIVEYQAYARRRRLRRSRWVSALFGAALVISMALNGAYLYAHRPAPEHLPEWLSLGVAVAFAVFVPLLIGVASLARGELEDDRLRLSQASVEAAQERAELERLRGEHAELARECAGLRDEHPRLLANAQLAMQLRAELAQEAELRAQTEGQVAQLRAELAHAEQVAAQERAKHAQTGVELAHVRAAAARLQEELAQMVEPGALDVLAIARRLRERGVTSREAAQLVGIPESTLRSRLKQVEPLA
jgi:uncharacterized membrane protein